MSLTNKTLENSIVADPGTCCSGNLKKGQFIRVTDVEGGQVADFVSHKQDDPTEYFDCLYTNMANSRWRWNEGATLFTNRMNRMWLITDDQTGIHFTGGGFCSNDTRRFFYDAEDTTKGCRDRLEEAFSNNGVDPQLLQSTSCFNLFMNLNYNDDGSWSTLPPVTKAGDYIELRAEMDIFWALSVCIWPGVNTGEASPLRIETYSR